MKNLIDGKKAHATGALKPSAGPGSGFKPGHPRLGGRRKHTAAQARALADELGVDPLEYMLGLLAVDATEEIVIDGAGKQKRVKVPVGRDLKIDICKTLANFFYPRLTATQVTGQNDGPIAVAGLNMIELMRDPIAIEAAQNLALAMAAQDQPPVESARALPAASEEPQHHPAIDPLDTLKTDGKGHWIPR